MKKSERLFKNIPLSVSLQTTLRSEDMLEDEMSGKNRVLTISLYAIIVAAITSLIAKFLIYLIQIVTNISFYGNFSADTHSPADNHLGLWVIAIPAIGGLIVGLMALYGSRAIRGHGIPEAMEQILTNKSKIKPAVTFLKPISSAVAIGTGGPFGAEGPIIATGGALGSTFGQMLKISHNERKILLAAGATAGMAAVFGSPVAAIFLAIELLLFEFSPRSIIPVALACITGAAGHHILFSSGPVFKMDMQIATPSNTALAVYSILGILIGFASVGVTKIVYVVEDIFEKIPIHWMWWPAIGGLVVGIIGYFAPHTLGVGYDNITLILSGNVLTSVIINLCVLKFVSWAIALGSGTSGGTLAPLLTIGGALGLLCGNILLHYFPNCGITLPLAALVGMSALFAGASRAFITSIIFAVETTSQSNALLPLLACCGSAYIISYFLMKETIMTEKISRRGVKAPDSYEADVLGKILVNDVMKTNGLVISEDNTAAEVLQWLEENKNYNNNYLIVTTNNGAYKGIISLYDLHRYKESDNVASLIAAGKNISISGDNTLRAAVQLMVKEKLDVLPVLSEDESSVAGILSYRDILECYGKNMDEFTQKNPDHSLRHRSLRMLVRGQQLVRFFEDKITTRKFTK